MGFPGAGVRMPKAIKFLPNLLEHIKFMFMMTLSCLGLLNPLEESYHLLHHGSYVLTMDRPSPSLVPVPISTFKASIKKRLPVVSYHTYLRKQRMQEAEDADCAVCLNGFKKGHKIRELSNCNHVFHRECLDSWLDEGKVTCPLCRSLLLTEKEKTKTCGDPWRMERTAYLFGETI